MGGKKNKLVKLLEQYEKTFCIQNSAIYNEDGLVVSIGFNKKYIDEHVLGVYCVKLMDSINDVKKNVFELPHGVTKDVIKLLGNGVIPKRSATLSYISINMAFEVLDLDTLQNVMQPTLIILLPLREGFVCFIIDNERNFLLIPTVLPRMRREIEEILFA